MTPTATAHAALALAENAPDELETALDLDLDSHDAELYEAGSALDIALPGRW